MVSNPEMFNLRSMDDGEFPIEIMRVLIGVFGTLIVLGIIYGICEIVSGVFIKQRKYRLFSFSVAIPRILFIPYGTILSIFTLMLLERDTVKQQYENNERKHDKRM